MKSTQSPVNERFNAIEVDRFPVSRLIELYKAGYGIDITEFIEDEFVRTYKCERSGLEFYRGVKPGDGQFYSELMKHDWYYNPWKWEHQITSELLKKDEALLEIGCGSGGFLSGIDDLGLKTEGVELNLEAVAKCQSKGLNVSENSLSELAELNTGKFDWVVSFQVAEHILDVAQFFEDSARLLKECGRLLVSVPNNDSFIKYSKENVLNLPPHHVNKWNATSLRNVGNHFGLRMESMHYEPLQQEHVNWYVQTILNEEKKEIDRLLPGLKGWFFRKHKKFLDSWVQKESDNILGHSVIAIYKKK
jgi:2-polyprenyl-3-methyl-5-hydroxy-6-metoxy-1,4-benzoquinol methylase